MKMSLLINMKMPSIVGIFIFISRENVMLSSVEHEKRLITSGSGFFPQNFKFPPFIFYILFQHENQLVAGPFPGIETYPLCTRTVTR